jgi:succinyl-CoA synthetase alpha subunit
MNDTVHMTDMSRLRGLGGTVVCLGLHSGIIQSVIDYDYLRGRERPSVTAIIAGGRKQARFFWGEDEVEIPVLPSLERLPPDQSEDVNFLLNVQSARRVLDSTADALDRLPNLAVGTVFAEHVPEAHALELQDLASTKGVMLTGPASVGLLVPGTIKLGAIGGTQPAQITAAGILHPGDRAILSTSGGMINELIHTVTGNGLGVSFALALGGDRYPATSPADGFLLAEADPSTEHIVYFGTDTNYLGQARIKTKSD